MKYLLYILLIVLALEGLSFASRLEEPRSVAIDKKGFVYVLDRRGTWRYRLQKYRSDGNFAEILNRKMISLWLDEGDLKNLRQDEINEKFLTVIKYLRVKPNKEAILAKIFYPDYITIGRDGLIYAVGADSSGEHGRAGVIDPEDGHTIMAFGEFTKEDKPYGLWNPRGIAIDGEENIYVANQGPYCVKKFEKNGKFIKRWAPRGSGRGKFKDPMGIAIDRRDSSVYVLDDFIPSGIGGTIDQPRQMRIQKFSKDGKFIKKWGERPGIAWNPFLVYPRITGIPELDEPAGIAIDGKGFVYVVERRPCRVNKFDSNGKLILQWGKRGKGTGEFDFTTSAAPIGMATDKDDNIYIADTDNNRVQKFDSNGKFLMEIK